MREAVIADLVALAHDPLEQARVQIGVEADDEEEGPCALVAEDVQDTRREARSPARRRRSGPPACQRRGRGAR